MALEILYKGSRGKGKYTGRRELTSQREIKTCFRLAFTVGSQFDFFVTAIARFKMIYAREEEGKEGEEGRKGGRERGRNDYEYECVGRVADGEKFFRSGTTKFILQRAREQIF